MSVLARPKVLAASAQGATAHLLRPLRAAGFEVDVVTDGLEAYERFCRVHYDAMLVQADLPGLSGLELVENAHALRRAMPVLLVGATEDDAARAAALGVETAPSVTAAQARRLASGGAPPSTRRFLRQTSSLRRPSGAGGVEF